MGSPILLRGAGAQNENQNRLVKLLGAVVYTECLQLSLLLA